MSDLPSRIDALRPKIEELMRIGGTPGLALGISHPNSPTYYATLGYRDVREQLAFNAETILPVCSFTKAVTSAALGILVDEKKASWDTLVKDALPALNIQDETLQNQMTITDLLCHRTGISWGDNLFIGTENNILISGKQTMDYINSQNRLLPFRSSFSYSNIAFDLAGKVVESLSGQSYFEFVQERIFKPLGMNRTSLTTPPKDKDNVAKCYNALDDGTTAQIPCVKTGDDWFGGPSAGMRSTLNDTLKLYRAFLTCFNDQFITGETCTEGYPLKQVAELMTAKVPIDQPSRNEASYGLGWVRAQLPGRIGHVGCNPSLMPNGMPTVGKGVASRLVIYHQGSLPGALAWNAMVPDLQSVIVVVSNSLALNDVPDWVGQLILEELVEVPSTERNDYIAIAKLSRDESLKWYPKLQAELQSVRKNGTTSKPLEAYTGVFWDLHRFFKIIVKLEQGELYWYLQGLDSEKFRLTHYEDDSFTWLQARNELSRRGRWVGSDQGAEFWKVHFKTDGDGNIDRLLWVHDNDVPAVEYRKE